MTYTERFVQRFWSKVDTAGECWSIAAAASKAGYKTVRVGDRIRYAHRVAYELAIGPIPDGLVLDHLCRNRACCNPDHLEPVTNRENILRGDGASAVNARREPLTDCPIHGGEDMSPRLTGKNGCRICTRERHRRHRQNLTPERQAELRVEGRERARRRRARARGEAA